MHQMQCGPGNMEVSGLPRQVSLLHSMLLSASPVLPFHQVENWTGSFFKAAWLCQVGLEIHLGHGGNKCPCNVDMPVDHQQRGSAGTDDDGTAREADREGSTLSNFEIGWDTSKSFAEGNNEDMERRFNNSASYVEMSSDNSDGWKSDRELPEQRG